MENEIKILVSESMSLGAEQSHHLTQK